MKPPRKITGMAVMIGAIFALFTSGKDAFAQLDPTFHPPYFAVPDFSSRVLLLPDGKYVVYFNAETLRDQPTGAITRYLADGTLDTSFNFSRDYQSVSAAAGLADGKLIVATNQFIYGLGANDNYHQSQQILRLNADGSIDPSFSSTAKTTDGAEVRAIGIQPDGKILVAGRFTAFNGSPRRGIVRLLLDGTVDPNFAAVTMTDPPMPFGGGGISGLWTEPKVQADGKILIAGDFIGVNGNPCPGVARLNADGSLDSTFQPSDFQPTNTTSPRPIRGIAIQSNGQIVIGGKFTVSASFVSNHTGMTYTRLPLIRLNSDGSADQSYGYFDSMNTADSTFVQIRAIVMQLDGKVVAVDNSVFRFNTDSSLDTTFRQPDLLIDRSTNLFPEAFTINLRSDGRILIGGDFSDVDDAPPLPANGERWGVAQFNSDGTLDSFTTSHRQAYNAYPTSFLRLADGLTLIGFNQLGAFSGHSAIHHNFGRLLPDGSLDTSFNPLASLPGGPVTAQGFSVVPNGNGNIFGWGTQDATGNFKYNVLLPDGTIADPNYTDDPNVGFDDAYPLTNGQVLVGTSTGAQSVINNTELQRLNSNGSLDASFVLDASIVANREQRDVNGNLQTVATGSAVVALFSDGKILFAYLAADSTYRLVRLNPNGSLDSTFQAGSAPVSTTSFCCALVYDPQNNTGASVTVLSPNGVPGFSGAQVVAGNQLVVVGQFASYADVPAHGIVRLNGDGSVDGTFQAGNGAQWTQTTQTATFHPSVDNIEQAGNAKLLITGTFEAFNGVPLPGMALLHPDGSLDTSFVPPATRRKFDYHTAYLGKQPDNSFLLSGPYSLPNQTQSPSFIHIFGAPVITSPATATATQGQLFVYQVTATGTPTSYSATPLPAGLTFDSAHGILGGTPTDPGTPQIQLTASNSFGTGMATLTLTVQTAPSSGHVTSGTSITARTGQPFSFEVFTTGGSATARLSATGLPPGLSVDPVTGIISGTPTADGSFGVILTVTDGDVTTTSTLQLTFTSDPAIPVIISPRETTLAAGQPFFYRIDAPSSGGPTTFSYIGTLPSGLVFDPATGTISGTYNPHFQNGGALLGNVQIIATNSSGTATSTLAFFQQVPATAKNISTRLAVGTSDDVLIGGFIIQGNAPKKVIIRAIGPSLTQYNVPNALQDPFLELHDGSGALIGQNDNWGTTIPGGVITGDQVAEIQATGLAPGDSRESAIISTLQPGNYTAIVRGVSSTTGNALVEVYDLDTTHLDVSINAQLGNISTRGLVQTGDNVMIGGFIVRGELPATVIVRAIGPSLAQYGITNPLLDPTLELHDGTGAVIGGNDNWQDDPGAAQIQADNLAPSDPRESATIVTLAPGNYTAIVRGSNGTTGVALVEGFVIP